MLLTTTNNNIYVLDAYGGEKVSYPSGPVLLMTKYLPVNASQKLFAERPKLSFFLVCDLQDDVLIQYLDVELLLVQRCGFSLEPSPNTTTEATITPDGQYVISGIKPLSYLLLEKNICMCDIFYIKFTLNNYQNTRMKIENISSHCDANC